MKSWTFYIDSVPPTVSNVQVNGMSSIIIPKGTMVTLSAVIDDSTTSGSAISGANYTVGFQIWPGISMSPSDGSFDSSLENTEITIDTSGWLDGAYNLYIYGWDEHLNYNYSSTAYVTIVIDSTQPYSTINPFSKYWFASSPISINATADDIESNVESIELWHKFSNDNTSWNSWTLFGIDFESPWNWHFDFPNMDGYYEFYTTALDSSSNYEIKMKADAICGYDTTPPIADAGSKKDAFFRTEFEFDGGNSTDNILIINYTWTFWDAITHTLYGPTPSYTFSFHHRDLLVDLQVTDIAGNRDNDSILINVYDFPKPGRIFGRVIDINGTPIPEAWVNIKGSRLRSVNYTDVQGYYSFDNVPYGNYKIIVRKPDYQDEEVSDLTISEEVPTIHLDIKLTKTPEEVLQICILIYGLVIFIVIVFFMFLYLNVRKLKPREPKKGKGLVNENIQNEYQPENDQAPPQETRNPPQSLPLSEI